MHTLLDCSESHTAGASACTHACARRHLQKKCDKLLSTPGISIMVDTQGYSKVFTEGEIRCNPGNEPKKRKKGVKKERPKCFNPYLKGRKRGRKSKQTGRKHTSHSLEQAIPIAHSTLWYCTVVCNQHQGKEQRDKEKCPHDFI